MSKHINLVISDTLYSSIISFMVNNNINNFSSAVRLLLIRQLDSHSDLRVSNTDDASEAHEWVDDFIKRFAPELM